MKRLKSKVRVCLVCKKRLLQDRKLSINNLSIIKIFKDLNCEILFQEKNMIFHDLIPKERIDEGHLENDLYILDNNNFIFNSRKDKALSELWHKTRGTPFRQDFEIYV
jgi:hypothetical protein